MEKEICFEKCESCGEDVDIEIMNADDDSNWFCPECWLELEPIINSDYENLKD